MTLRRSPTSRCFAILVLAALSAILLAPTTFASGPNSKPVGTPHGSSTRQDPQWLKAKNEYRILSGITPGQGKGAHTHPSVLSVPFFNPSAKTAGMTPNTNAPSSYTLGTGPYYIGEPSDGNNSNFPGTSNTYDDKYHHYNDKYMYTLCGPGAVDVATDYWDLPPNLANYTNVNDPINAAQSTSWNGTDLDSTTRMRGYMAHLAFQIEALT